MKRLAFAIALAALVSSSRAAHADGTPHSTLFVGDYLFQGQGVVADAGYYHLEMQTDGNLVLYAGAGTGDATWWTGTDQLCSGSWPFTVCTRDAAQYATLQSDGNFVVYFYEGLAGWASNTAGGAQPSTSQIRLQQDGNLVEYRGDLGGSDWASNTAGAVIGQGGGAHSSITHIDDDTNLAGGDYRDELTNDPMQCGQWCAGSAWAPAGTTCNAFTWVPPGVQASSGICWLKGSIPAASFGHGMVSGSIRH